MSKLGGFLVQYRYRVAAGHVDKALALLALVAEHADDLGLATYEVWTDDDQPGEITELCGYDSWSHWRRLADVPPASEMQRVYQQLDDIIEGGLAAVEARQWRPQRLEPAARG